MKFCHLPIVQNTPAAPIGYTHLIIPIQRVIERQQRRDARHLFEYIAYDLDKQQITDFRLKPWANQFLYLRIGLYMEENYSGDYNDNPVAPTGLEVIRLPLVDIVEWLLTASGLKHALQRSRNELIRKRYALGEGLSDLAREYGISPQRVYQIVNSRRK